MENAEAISTHLRIDDWVYLRAFDRVELRRSGEFPATGWIDDITRDAKVFWVNLDRGCGRILVHEGDEVEVRLVV